MAERKRTEATLKKRVSETDCFVDGCKKAEGTCKGIQGSIKCAACRLHKNAVGIEWGM